MASDIKRPSPWRKALWIFLALLALLLALAGWLLGTASGARAAFDLLSGSTLQVQGIHGRLAGPLQLEKLTLERPNDRITLTGIKLDWRPSALLQSRLHLISLRIGHLDIFNKLEQKPEPAALPDRIALPFALQADEVQVDSGDIHRGPIDLVKLGPFAFNLDFNGTRYQLRLHRFAAGSALERGTVATDISGQASLSTAKPYALQGSFSAKSNAVIREQTIGATGHIALAGSLAELVTELDLAVNQAPIKGRVVLRPFSEQALGAAQLTAQALDLSRLGKTLPRTALDIKLSAAENGAGELIVNNAAAGPYNEEKVPVSALRISFKQDAGQFLFAHIVARLGSAALPAGEIGGYGRYADGALTLALGTEALDAQRLDRRIRATRLAGKVDVRHAAGKQQFTLALSEPLRKQRITLEVHGVLADAGLAIERAKLQAGEGRIEASAHVGLDGAQSFRAEGRVSRFRLQELGDFAQMPALDLNGNFTLRGVRQPQLEADLAFHISDSRLAGQPLLGDGQAQLRGDRLLVPKFLLQSGANRLHIQGQLSQDDSQLVFTLQAPRLAQLGPAFGGAMQANGTARGTLTRPRISAEWSASNARMPGALQIESMQGKAEVGLDRNRPFIFDTVIADLTAGGMRYGADRLATLAARIRFAPQPAAPLALTIRADGISAGRLRAERFNASASGATGQHTIDMVLDEPDQSWKLKANGSLTQLARAARWQGSIVSFDAGGRFNARLASPAPLLLSAQRVQLDRFMLDADSGHIALEHFARDASGIATRGRIERLQLAQLLRYADPAPPLKTDLQFGGEWDVRIADTLTGSIMMRRERGDVTMLGSAPVTLGLNTLEAAITAAGGRLALQLQAEGRQLGRINVDAGTRIGGGASRLAIAPDAPVSGSARIDMPSLGWIAPLVSPSLVADGRLHSAVSVEGTFGQPRFSGRIAGSALKLAFADLGLDLRQGSLQGEFQGERLQLSRLEFLGSEGRVSVSGPVDLGGGAVAAELALRADGFALLNHSERRLVVSGDSRIALRERRARISGAFVVNSGFFDLGHADKPQLSNDVVIVGSERKQAAGMAAQLDLSIAIDDSVLLKGRGLNAVLGGNMRLASDAGGAPQAQGTLHIAKGTYTTYGRELAIEQGLLKFGGALSNPALDILAMRREQEVEAGVSVRGTALAPRVTLVSEPPVPDAEKLSWLVLGRGLSTAGETDLGALQRAAGALLSEGAAAGVQARIASAFGLDTFSIGTSQDNMQQRIVTLGKQISSRLYLGYQQGLESAGSVVQLRYVLSPRLSLEGEAGARSAVSLFYNIAFD